ncbi:WD domain, G-beta repeat protein [Dictyocaulus viviparus]|uniref:WD domain, G-beta repeat protein n=1 Tax=Dictyocaulus viviparus TaxID=29172 RepID=A0A0D8XBB8_DICVI|nr:WD domain, G-beta repeat protein [Dictyocaulus viviparus]
MRRVYLGSDLVMGNKYTSLSTCDPNDLLISKERQFIKKSATFSPPLIRPAIHSDSISAMVVVRPGMVITGSRDKSLALNNVDTGECITRWTGHDAEVTKLAFGNTVGNHFVLSGSRDQTIKLWQFHSQYPQKTFEGHSLGITGLSMLTENTFVSGSRDTTIKIWDVESTKRILRSTQMNRNLVTHITFNAVCKLIAQSSEDKEVKIWDPRNLELVTQLPRKHHIQMHCEFIDNNILASSSNGYNCDGCEISIWDLRMRKLVRELRGHEGSVPCVVGLTQQVTMKKLLMSVSMDRTVRIWNINDGVCAWNESISIDTDILQCVSFNDGHVVVSGGKGFLAHLRVQARAGKPYFQVLSTQKENIWCS